MVKEAQLSDVLSEFAQTMVTDFPIQMILDHFVLRIVDVLPISGAGVTLIAPGSSPEYVAASDADALRFEQLQTDNSEGPCLLAYESGKAVAVPDLVADHQFPLFSPPAIAAGLAAVFTFPLNNGDIRLGALDLYRDMPGELDARNMSAAQTLANVAACYLSNARARDEAREVMDGFRSSALFDGLTGLPNRLLLQQRLDHATQRAQRSLAYAGVLFVDLDDFKTVNDSHGHAVGDELLCAVAARLRSLVRTGDTLARMHGDEFVYLCEDLSAAGEVEGIAARIARSFDEPFMLATGAELRLTVSASVALAYAGPGEDMSQQLLADAGRAMDEIKRHDGKKKRAVLDLRVDRHTGERTSLRRDLHDAFAQRRLSLAYQPIVSMADGLCGGVEALVQWNDPHRGQIPARAVIDMAEQDGLIVQLGAWVLEHACRARDVLSHRHPDRPLDVFVNVSARQLMGPGFRDTVARVLDETSLDPAALVLELTESILIDDVRRAVLVLNDLKGLGVRLALDDFGSGFSGLSRLQRFPVDIVKIDKTFVAALDEEPGGTAMITAVTGYAHALQLGVIAEGVEASAQHDKLVALGCDQAQGFLYGRPMPMEELSASLASSSGDLHRLPAGTATTG